MPRGIRGSGKKPSISRVKPQKTVEEPAGQDADAGLSSADLIVEHLRVLTHTHFTNIVTIMNTRLEEIVNLLTERNELAKKLDAPEPSDAQDSNESMATWHQEVVTPLIERIEKMSAGYDVLHEKLEAVAKSVALLEKGEPAPAKRGRPPKAPEASAPAPELAKLAPKSEVIICKHIRMEVLRPGLERCLDCGAVMDVPVKEATPAPAAPAPAAPAAPAPATNGAKPPSVDDVRAVAITYAGKHGKPKLSELLKEFGASNLSTVPEESRAALMAKLQAGI